MKQQIVLEPYNNIWAKQYELEQQNIINALGMCTNGGAIFKMTHIGSTSIPNMPAKPCIDIAIDAYPTPLPAKSVAALEAIGYEYLGENGIEGREYFRKGPNDFHIHVSDHDYPHWENHLIFRDYLRANKQVANDYGELKIGLARAHPQNRKAYQNGKSEFITKTLKDATQWHIATTAFSPLEELSTMLEGLDIPWHISSGWALDLFTNTPSRYHDDLDVIIQRKHQLELQRELRKHDWDLHYVVSGKYAYWQNDTHVPKEAHQVHAIKDGRLIDILLEPDRTNQWIYRRNPEIKQSLDLAFQKQNRIPYLSPELVLLFKATIRDGKIRDKDQSDFKRVLPYLTSEQKEWLKQAIALDSNTHPWIQLLS